MTYITVLSWLKHSNAFKKNMFLNWQIFSKQCIYTPGNIVKVPVNNFCAVYNSIKYSIFLFRELSEGKEESQHQQPDDSHNVGVYVERAHGGHNLYRPKRATENFEEFLAILKKL